MTAAARVNYMTSIRCHVQFQFKLEHFKFSTKNVFHQPTNNQQGQFCQKL